MTHEINNKEITIKNSDIVFEKIYSEPYVPKDFLNDIKKANLLLIPSNGFRNYEHLVFPELTLEFLNYIRENATGEIISDIAISDDDFQKLELHSASIKIATFIVSAIVLPLAINLVSNFLYDEAKKHLREPDDLSAEITIIVQDGDKSKEVSYKGPISGIKSTFESISDGLFDTGETNDD